jgi:hypothetical protein
MSIETMKPTACPFCGHVTPATEYAEDGPHAAGEVVCCLNCRQITIGTGNGCEVRKPTDRERIERGEQFARIERYVRTHPDID